MRAGCALPVADLSLTLVVPIEFGHCYHVVHNAHSVHLQSLAVRSPPALSRGDQSVTNVAPDTAGSQFNAAAMPRYELGSQMPDGSQQPLAAASITEVSAARDVA
jgi:hypothetical protein